MLFDESGYYFEGQNPPEDTIHQEAASEHGEAVPDPKAAAQKAVPLFVDGGESKNFLAMACRGRHHVHALLGRWLSLSTFREVRMQLHKTCVLFSLSASL